MCQSHNCHTGYTKNESYHHCFNKTSIILTIPDITAKLATLTSTNTLTTPKVGVTAVSNVSIVTVVLPITIAAFVLALDSVTIALCNVSVALSVSLHTFSDDVLLHVVNKANWKDYLVKLM